MIENPASAKDPFDYVREWDRLRQIKGWWHSFELPDGTAIEGVSSLKIQKERIAAFPISHDLKGKRVLDIGTWDGWFAFEMERRGADRKSTRLNSSHFVPSRMPSSA